MTEFYQNDFCFSEYSTLGNWIKTVECRRIKRYNAIKSWMDCLSPPTDKEIDIYTLTLMVVTPEDTIEYDVLARQLDGELYLQAIKQVDGTYQWCINPRFENGRELKQWIQSL